MRKKIKKIMSKATIVLPFIVAIIGIAECVATKDTSHLSRACLWGMIGCLEGEIYLLEEKIKGIIH